MNIDLSNLDCTVAVTGLKTGDNPQPGTPVIRCLRDAGFKGRIVALVYDTLEAGIFVEDLADDIYVMPYPSGGSEVFLKRLDYILSQVEIDVIIPTLDSEIINYIRLQDELSDRGIKFFLPTEEQFQARDKTRLNRLFENLRIGVPKSFFCTDAQELYNIATSITFPFFIKGKLYEAYEVFTLDDAFDVFGKLKSKWGLPVIVQQKVYGDEFNIALLGDGKGGMLGMIPQRKLIITDKGKGFGGVVVDNPELKDFAEKVIKALNWRGPAELEVIQNAAGEIFIIEINPRFPAWIRLSAGAGQNLPAMDLLMALGLPVEPLTEYETGTIFIRHSEDVISHINKFGTISSLKELHNKEGK
jgi:carbamoyl-phosphate synthase large subunit